MRDPRGIEYSQPPSAAQALAAHYGGDWAERPLGASGFCATWCVQGGDRTLFVKTLPAARADVLEAEADGLAALSASHSIAVPSPVASFMHEAQRIAVLALEWLDLAPSRADFGARFGRALGSLHARTRGGPESLYGWRRDNFLGATAQSNAWSTAGGTGGWVAFFGSERLGAMRTRLCAAGAPPALASAIDRVIAALPELFDDGYEPRPSLVHGDLWSGNWGSLRDGTPVSYDPAVSMSDAEADLAMMELFGSPPADFWPAYREVAGLAPGYPRRRPVYQLYHVLNHELLFGGYAHRAMAIVDGLLRRPGRH